MTYKDRRSAGRELAGELEKYQEEDVIVLGLPRGGVEVAYEVAEALNAPLDVIVTRKLGAPSNPEYGFGAIGPGGVRVLDDRAVQMLGLDEDQIDRIADREQGEMERRLQRYRGDRPMPELEKRTVIVVDDGVATGGTARAAIRALHELGAGTLVLAVPVAPPDTADELEEMVDDFVCLQTPTAFMAVGQWYRDFSQTTDGEVEKLLEKAQSN
ncbi:MAG: phosphoribosyltransferase [Candidatus Brocadiia bacterium]